MAPESRMPSRPSGAVRPITNEGVPETPRLVPKSLSFCHSASMRAVSATQDLKAPASGRYVAAHSSGDRPTSQIRYVVVHSTEGDTAQGAAAWFANPASGAVNGNVVRVCGQSLLGA